jgi:hypothetical protein
VALIKQPIGYWFARTVPGNDSVGLAGQLSPAGQFPLAGQLSLAGQLPPAGQLPYLSSPAQAGDPVCGGDGWLAVVLIKQPIGYWFARTVPGNDSVGLAGQLSLFVITRAGG